MLLKKYKVVNNKNGFVRFVRTKVGKLPINFCEHSCKLKVNGRCYGQSFCGRYIIHLEFSSKVIGKLKYHYYIDVTETKINS